jgi:hypothetical protein
MTDRQPIETALKDGTILRLLCSTGGANPKTFEALGQYRDLGAWGEVDKNTGLLMPTHWMPLADDTAP